MLDLSKRTVFWDTHHREACQGGTPILVDQVASAFQGSVLEIGPGEGRQFRVAHPLSAYYAVADISPEVLSNPLYENVERHQLTSYGEDTGVWIHKFDVVHCWYLVHHLLPDERPTFFGFVRRRLKAEGVFLFNIPVGNPEAELGADGMLTTPVNKEDVLRELDHAGLRSFAVV